MRGFTCDEQHRPRRDGRYIVEWVEIHELHVAGERRMGRKLRRTARGCELTPRRAIEVVKFALNGNGAFGQPMYRPAGVLCLAICKLHIALLRGLFENRLS